MPCDTCDVVRPIRIRVPSDLTSAITSCKAMVANGILIPSSFWPVNRQKFTQEPWASVREEGGWDDFVEYFFECTACEKRFFLRAETYHGSGGSFATYESVQTAE